MKCADFSVFPNASIPLPVLVDRVAGRTSWRSLKLAADRSSPTDPGRNIQLASTSASSAAQRLPACIGGQRDLINGRHRKKQRRKGRTRVATCESAADRHECKIVSMIIWDMASYPLHNQCVVGSVAMMVSGFLIRISRKH